MSEITVAQNVKNPASLPSCKPTYEEIDNNAKIVQVDKNTPAKGLYGVFNKDTLQVVLDKPLSKELENCQTLENYKTNDPTLREKFVAWWKGTQKNTVAHIEEPSNQDNSPIAPVNSVPTLELPDNLPPDLENILVSHPPFNVQKLLTTQEIYDSITAMSDRTIESIMFIIFKVQFESEQKWADGADKTYSKYMEFQKKQGEVLQELKEVLMKDENFLAWVDGAQNVLTVASLLTGIGLAAASFGVLGPLGEFIAQMGAGAAAGLAAVAKGTEMYYKGRWKDSSAKLDISKSLDTYYDHRADDARERLLSIGKSDNMYKDAWIRLMKRMDGMKRIVLRK